jgi:hypothetical protein
MRIGATILLMRSCKREKMSMSGSNIDSLTNQPSSPDNSPANQEVAIWPWLQRALQAAIVFFTKPSVTAVANGVTILSGVATFASMLGGSSKQTEEAINSLSKQAQDSIKALSVQHAERQKPIIDAITGIKQQLESGVRSQDAPALLQSLASLRAQYERNEASYKSQAANIFQQDIRQRGIDPVINKNLYDTLNNTSRDLRAAAVGHNEAATRIENGRSNMGELLGILESTDLIVAAGAFGARASDGSSLKEGLTSAMQLAKNLFPEISRDQMKSLANSTAGQLNQQEVVASVQILR